jgi:hypothetical protein
MSAWYILTWVEGAVAGQVAHRPDPVGDAQPLIDRDDRGR